MRKILDWIKWLAGAFLGGLAVGSLLRRKQVSAKVAKEKAKVVEEKAEVRKKEKEIEVKEKAADELLADSPDADAHIRTRERIKADFRARLAERIQRRRSESDR